MSTDQPDESTGSFDNFDDATIEYEVNRSQTNREIARLIGDDDATPSMEDMHRALRLIWRQQVAQNLRQLQQHHEAMNILARHAQYLLDLRNS